MLATKIQLKTDTIANWTLNENALLLNGEAAVVQFEDGTSKIKIGDGVTPFKDLPYVAGADMAPGFSCDLSFDGGRTLLSTFQLYYIKISESEYHELVKNGQTLSNAIYEVSSDVTNCYGERLINVAEPERDNDAATKGYVDQEILKIDIGDQLTGYATKNYVDQEISKIDVSDQLTGYAEKATTLAGYGITDAKIDSGTITLGTNTITPLTAHQSLDGYYGKTETSSASELSGEFLKYQLSGDYLSATADHTTSAQVSAIVEDYGFSKVVFKRWTKEEV